MEDTTIRVNYNLPADGVFDTIQIEIAGGLSRNITEFAGLYTEFINLTPGQRYRPRGWVFSNGKQSLVKTAVALVLRKLIRLCFVELVNRNGCHAIMPNAICILFHMGCSS